MTRSKPDDATWKDYAYEQNCIKSEEYTEFAEVMAEQARDALRESEVLDESRYCVEATDRNSAGVLADGWEMGVDDVLRLRDTLRECGVGDETVSVRCNTAGPKTEVSENLPRGIPRGVVFELWADVEETQELLGEMFGCVEEAMAETGGY